MAGATSVKYTHWNHFKDGSDAAYASYVETKDASDLSFVEGLGDATGGHANDLYIEADPITTFQFKGGVLYELGDVLSFFNAIPVVGKVSDDTDVWINFGFIDKAPVFDQVIQDWDGTMSTDPQNEKFTAFELGLNLMVIDGGLPAVGRNAGAKLATTHYILFLDADVTFTHRYAIKEAFDEMINGKYEMVGTTPVYKGEFDIRASIMFGINKYVTWFLSKTEPFAIGGFTMVVDKYLIN